MSSLILQLNCQMVYHHDLYSNRRTSKFNIQKIKNVVVCCYQISQNVWAIESILLLIMGIEPGEFFFSIIYFQSHDVKIIRFSR